MLGLDSLNLDRNHRKKGNHMKQEYTSTKI
jgi:hypothetical protein